MILLRRCFWRCIGRLLFRCSPHPTYGYRRLLLKLAGMRQGRNVRFRRSVDIDHPWNISIGDLTMIGDDVLMRASAPIRIGARCVISQYCTLLTSTRETAPSEIMIEDDCWVATDSLVLPGARLEDGVVVGARAMVEGHLPGWQIATGEPAVARRERVLNTGS
ncbi:MAG: colanic acid biosynthesis acetyltransferase WcaF [Phycisphaerae bacterium]|nr:colanic acid biosynthesis acetyltransferase WcaF [Phycisphaerae bacterium]